MFDWNEEELTNIIWDDAGETDSHMVAYQEVSENCCSKKEWNQATATIQSNEKKTPGDKFDLHGRNLEGSPDFDTNGGIGTSGVDIGSWPELSLSNAAKTDQDSMGSEVPNSLVKVTQCSSKNETAELSKDPENFQNPDEGKEQGDFVDYSWANIGSFDDLDRIFSNDDPIFGNVSLGSASELWSSSKEVTDSPGKSFPRTVDSPGLEIGALKSAPEHLEIKSEYEQQDNQSLSLSYGKMDGFTSHGLHTEDFPGDKRKSIIEEQINVESTSKTSASKSHLAAENVMTADELANKAGRLRKLLEIPKNPEEIGEAEIVPDLFDTWSPSGNPLAEYENNLATSMLKSSPTSVVNQQKQLRGSDSLQYQHISNSFVAPSTYGNLLNQSPVLPALSNIQSGEFYQQPILSCCDVSPGKANHVNRSVEAAATPLSMTPREKIEKLRRRQQMQALLAIQKQQQQFSNQVPCTSHSFIQKSTQQDQFQHIGGADVEDVRTPASFDPGSPQEQDGSNTVSVAIDDYSLEEKVLYQLQDIITKLDVRIRLCIRDSLFRLAQNAMQRHYASDTSSTNKSSRDENKVAKVENENHNRMSDAETETNPIDRTIAHLLFHRPLELSRKYTETPESPTSSKFSFECKSAGLMSSSLGCISDDSQVKQNLPHQASEVPSPLMDSQHLEQFNSPCLDSCENASAYGPADGGAAEVEASQ
ncbi:NIGHT LIGHT-INDUCIBLE AND CLOCK-REGULATED GENE 2 [Hibiscus trionum]|uniref:NIGHT LIGHT-INDUCIBLE AND CLOCK-REGULATED GENE 2 n=1 Tax=Hibiscus trionum TaxID=183268 RepID=A0A9W7M723_HIBTR|nr:NIGHT LIGHT-INDUCIBLE AND CLOCK-REGULATED GENE 2 [Hibiscus trionum]